PGFRRLPCGTRRTGTGLLPVGRPCARRLSVRRTAGRLVARHTDTTRAPLVRNPLSFRFPAAPLVMLLAACSSGDAVSDRDAVEPAAILASAGDISVVAAAAPAPPIETGPMAVYVVLANAGTVPDTLTGVSS